MLLLHFRQRRGHQCRAASKRRDFFAQSTLPEAHTMRPRLHYSWLNCGKSVFEGMVILSYFVSCITEMCHFMAHIPYPPCPCPAPALFQLIHAALLHFDSKRSCMATFTDTVNAAAGATVAATASPSHSAAYQPVRHSVPSRLHSLWAPRLNPVRRTRRCLKVITRYITCEAKAPSRRPHATGLSSRFPAIDRLSLFLLHLCRSTMNKGKGE